MRRTEAKTVARSYACAVVASLVAVALRVWFDRWLKDDSPFFTFYLAIIVSAWFGGTGPALLALVLGAVGAAWIHEESELGVGLYLLVGIAGMLLLQSLRSSQARTQRYAEELAVGKQQLEQEIQQRKRVDEEFASQELFGSFMDNSPAVAYMKDEQGKYVYLNRNGKEFCQKAGVESLGQTDYEMFPEEVARQFAAGDRDVLDRNETLTQEHITTVDETVYHWIDCKVPFRGPFGQRFIAGIAVDVTELKKAEKALRDSELRFRQLAENISEVFWLIDVEKKELVYISPAYEKIWGRSCQSLNESPLSFLEAIVPEDRQRITDLYSEYVRYEFTEVEYRIEHTDGSIRWIWDRGFPITDESGRLIRIAGVAADITTRKEAEQKLAEEQRLLTELYESQEYERQLVAYEIHDGIVQYAAAALMHLEGFAHSHLNGAQNSEAELALELMRRTVNEGRRLISGLRPMVLDERGISAAVQHLINEQPDPSTIEFVDESAECRLAPQLESAIYRIVQESLTNAHKHSQSEKVRVHLAVHKTHVRLEVRDWGQGFDPAKVSIERAGIRGMASRVRLLGGRMIVKSSAGQGTQIVVELPHTEPPTYSKPPRAAGASIDHVADRTPQSILPGL